MLSVQCVPDLDSYTKRANDVRTPELETAECENQFAGYIDLENDDFCRWMFGEEFMAEIERERKRNALLYETEEVVKMVV